MTWRGTTSPGYQALADSMHKRPGLLESVGAEANRNRLPRDQPTGEE